MNKIFLLLIVFLLYNAIFCENKQPNPHIITFFIKPMDEISEKDLEKENFENNIKNIKQAKELEKQFMELIERLKAYNLQYWQNGIYATYAGYSTYSDRNGQITFPRKAVKPKFNLLLTQSITPVLKKPNDPKSKTILGFVLSGNKNFKYYLLERIENIEKKLYNWQINEQTILENKLIPYDTIVVFVNPRNFFIPIGQVNALEGENLMLPNIYFVNKLSKEANAFKFLNIRRYFAPINKKFEFKTNIYQQRVEN